MLIREVRAIWLRCPIPVGQQHVSDFGRITSFDTTIVRIEVDDGLVGWGEAKAGVGSAGGCRSVVATVRDDLAPALVGQDARRLTAAWDTMYNGSRAGYAFEHARGFPALGRRGLTVSAIQAMTQLNEATLTFVPKVVGLFVALLLFLPWMLNVMTTYMANLLMNIPNYVH